jgi:transglutaminase-like putative cysteine protease
MTNRTLTALGIAGGLAVIGAGVAYSISRKRQASGALGRGPSVVGVVKNNGRTMTHYRGPITIDTRLRIIEHMVAKSSMDPGIRTLAQRLTRHCASRDHACETKAIFDHVASKVRYTGDIAPIDLDGNGQPEAVDLYQSADYTLNEAKGGDCDDHTIAVRSLTTVMGIPNASRVASYVDSNSPYSHIYPVAVVGGRKVPMDTTLVKPVYGREIPATRVLDYPR